jgi:protein-S-isoprenylcysteine O-methyltransferase Ste14
MEFLHQRPHFGPRPTRTTERLLGDIAIKCLGLSAGIAALFLIWWLFPFYKRSYYQPFFEAAWAALPWIMAAMCISVVYTEWRLGEARDHAWQLGLLATGRWRELDAPVMKTAMLALLVRAIFLPMNYCALFVTVKSLRPELWNWQAMEWAEIHFLLMKILWGLLIVAIIPGYLFSARALATHVRRADASWFGWWITMACYPPLLNGVFKEWLNYNPQGFANSMHKPWLVLTEEFSALFYLASVTIIALEVIHWWGESIMGIRASNLTHRGLITNGPFRLTRHPIYLSKCIGWLIIWMPFAMGDTVLESLRLTLLWCGVCLIYYGRAWVEERLLAADPDYVEYALWMDRYGPLAAVGRLCPPLTFAWKLRRWQANGAINRETVP